jgi:hypothetical protein
MRALEFSDAARNAKADAALALLDGGWLCLYDAGGAELAKLAFSSPAFHWAARGRAESLPIEPEAGAADGAPTRFRAYTRGMVYVFGGSAGPAGDGQEYDLEVDGDVREGGEVTVEQVTYTEPARQGETR